MISKKYHDKKVYYLINASILCLSKGRVFFMFKKLCAIFLAFFVLSWAFTVNDKPVFGAYAERFELYLLDNSSSAYIVSVSKDEYSAYKKIMGESCKVDKQNFSISDFLFDMGATLIFVEENEFGTSYFGFSPKIKYKKSTSGGTINLHVFIGESEVSIGSPVIFGSF